jgi:hypothetical protein
LKRLFLKIASVTVILLAGSLPFQNCSGMKFASGGQVSRQELQNAGNGEGYTGKPDVYVARDPENACADGSFVRGAIERRMSEGRAEYRLTKFNCAPVNPAASVSVAKELGNDGSGNPLQLVYQSVSFERDLPQPLSASYRLVCTSEAGSSKELPSDALSGGVSVTTAPSNESVWVVKNCDLSGACAVKNNCFFDASTGNSFAGDADCRKYAAPFGAVSQGKGRNLAGCSVVPR